MSRGGRRTGKTGTAYKNRSDLNPVKRLPVTVAPGQGYGQAKAQADSQAAVPMASGELQGGASPFASALASAQAAPVPPVVTADVPSQNPAEPVNGPAPAPPPAAQDPLLAATASLNSLGDNVSPEVKALRATVGAQLANVSATT